MAHPPTDGKRPAQQALCQGEIAITQGRPHARTGHPLTIDLTGGGIRHRKAELLAGLLQVGKITVPTTAETEIIPYHQIFHAQAIHQQGFHKGLCGQ